MYHTGKNPLQKVTYKSDQVETVKSPEQRKLHKALLRYHDPANWALIRTRLKEMGRAELIGDGPNQLIPEYSPEEKQMAYQAHRRKNTATAHKKRTGGKNNNQQRAKQGNVAKQKQGGATKTKQRKGKNIRTQHTGLPPLAEDETDQKPKQNASAKRAKKSKPRRKKKPSH